MSPQRSKDQGSSQESGGACVCVESLVLDRGLRVKVIQKLERRQHGEANMSSGKTKKLKANAQNFHDEKTCMQLSALYHAQRVASSTALMPDGSLAGFVPPTQAALRWQGKVGKDAVKAFLEGIGYLADTTLSKTLCFD